MRGATPGRSYEENRTCCAVRAGRGVGFPDDGRMGARDGPRGADDDQGGDRDLSCRCQGNDPLLVQEGRARQERLRRALRRPVADLFPGKGEGRKKGEGSKQRLVRRRPGKFTAEDVEGAIRSAAPEEGIFRKGMPESPHIRACLPGARGAAGGSSPRPVERGGNCVERNGSERAKVASVAERKPPASPCHREGERLMASA